MEDVILASICRHPRVISPTLQPSLPPSYRGLPNAALDIDTIEGDDGDRVDEQDSKALPSTPRLGIDVDVVECQEEQWINNKRDRDPGTMKFHVREGSYCLYDANRFRVELRSRLRVRRTVSCGVQEMVDLGVQRVSRPVMIISEVVDLPG
jgi:hypothetical protein